MTPALTAILLVGTTIAAAVILWAVALVLVGWREEQDWRRKLAAQRRLEVMRAARARDGW